MLELNPEPIKHTPIRQSIETTPRVCCDGGQVQQPPATAPDDGTLSRFQFEILYTLASEGVMYGLGIKDALVTYYGRDINHGRLYPNLDTLVEAGYVAKSARDDRTNDYTLTDDGLELVRRDAQRRHSIATTTTGSED